MVYCIINAIFKGRANLRLYMSAVAAFRDFGMRI